MAVKKPKKADIEASIYKQLELNGASDVAVYTDMVANYMRLYDIKEKLQADIKKRGVKVEMEMSTKVKKIVTNESIKDIMDVQSQMMSILDRLRIKPSECDGGGVIDVDM